MNKSTLLLASAITLSGICSASAFAVEGLTANASVTSNYVWRGVSQTQNQGAVSGGIDYAAASGFYLGTWASNVDFGDNTTAEVDLYAGYGFEIDQLTFDVGYLFYGYPGGQDLDFSEIYASVSWQFLTLGYNLLADSDYGSSFGDDDYLFADLAFEVATDLELSFHYGLSSYDAGGDYNDYGVSLSKDGFTLSVTDVDVPGSDVMVTVSYAIEFDL